MCGPSLKAMKHLYWLLLSCNKIDWWTVDVFSSLGEVTSSHNSPPGVQRHCCVLTGELYKAPCRYKLFFANMKEKMCSVVSSVLHKLVVATIVKRTECLMFLFWGHRLAREVWRMRTSILQSDKGFYMRTNSKTIVLSRWLNWTSPVPRFKVWS